MQRITLYVGDLHHDVTEYDLAYTFSQAGGLHSVHLCRDKSTGKSFCYAYVNFWTEFCAVHALRCLNHTPLKGKPMRIMLYDVNFKSNISGTGNLYVKNLDLSITSVKLENIFSKYGTVTSCKVVEIDGISRGFGYVQFSSEASAREALVSLDGALLEGKKLQVSEFRSKMERKNSRLRDIKHRAVKNNEYSNVQYIMCPNDSCLFVTNLDPSIDDKKLEEYFRDFGNVISTQVFRAGALICFTSPDNAKKVMDSLTGNTFNTKNGNGKEFSKDNKPFEEELDKELCTELTSEIDNSLEAGKAYMTPTSRDVISMVEEVE